MTNWYIIIEKFIFPEEGGVEHTALKFLVFNKRSGRELGQHKSKKSAETYIERLLLLLRMEGLTNDSESKLEIPK